MQRSAAGIFALLLCVAPVASAQPEILQSFARPSSIPFPDDAPYNREIAALGKMLFFDPRLSGGQNISCSSCHSPSFGWEKPVPRAIGASNRPVRRHAPTLLNAAWITPLFWDGRATSLEEQAVAPITARDEMNATFEGISARLSQVPDYQMWFGRLFPERGVQQETIVLALATYQRTIVSGTAKFDLWVEGAEGAISDAAKRGFDLFAGRGKCISCHSGWMFTDNALHDIGLVSDDLGAGDADPALRSHFKTPGLRNVALRAPYMHDGSVPSLEAVIRHYASGGANAVDRPVAIDGFEISEDEIADLKAFLETLTDTGSSVPSPILPAN